MGRRLGLLIGINHYQDSTFQPLRYAEPDASMFARWLGNERGGDWPSSEIYTLTGAEATKEQVESLVAQLCLSAAQPDDLVLIYFAGHAFIDEASGDGLLASVHTSYRRPASAIHLPSLVRQVMLPSRAGQVIVLLDCFQTGGVWNAQRATPYDFRPFIGQPSTIALQQAQERILYCSCRGNDLAPESGEQGCGSFIYRTIIGLSGPARNAATGQATLQQLHTYLSGKLSPQHQPIGFGQSATPIVLIGEAPVYAGVASPAYAASSSVSQSAYSLNGQAGQVTFQGVGESAPLIAPDTPRASHATGQLASSTSGPISISQVEQNYQQQCLKLMQQARQQLGAQRLPEALQLVEQVLRMAPNYSDALTLKTQILGTTARYQEALATNELLLQIEPGNALAWSMYAALLTNTGRLQEALTAINRALTLQPGNQEALAMRQSIQSSLPAQLPGTSASARSPYATRQPARESAASFLVGAGIQLLAFILGLLGAAIQVYLPSLPNALGFLLESFGLAGLCVLAARGSFRYGASRLLSTSLLCIAAAAILGGLYKFEYVALINKIVATPSLLVPIVFFAIWLIAAASLPLLAGLGGLILGLVMGVRRKR
ncbi:MAG TPA: tetratricopeptide repeat protein [Ktedonobacteraceae bacterium]|nr:tetratricopeptide repeat protein [Ktedonobacteraceae bacterium]